VVLVSSSVSGFVFFFLKYQVSVVIIISVMDSLFLAMQICYRFRAFLRNVFAHFLEMILAHFQIRPHIIFQSRLFTLYGG